MSYKVVNYGKKASRRNYGKIKSTVELPNLIEVQINSFNDFVENGIREIFDEISPIEDHNGKMKITFGEYSFDKAKYEDDEDSIDPVVEAKLRDINYSKPLKCKVKLENDQNGNVVEQELFMGDFPMMTPEGTFVINGAERVIVSQIVRSAGVFYSVETDKKTGQRKFTGQVIPTRGAWVEYEIDSKNIWYAKVDRSKKIHVTTLLRALGIKSHQEMIDLFGKTESLSLTINDDKANDCDEAIVHVYKKLRQDESSPADGARDLVFSRLFDPKKYDLARVGRLKYNKRLDVLYRAKNQILAEDVVNNETGEVIVEKGTKLTNSVCELLDKNRAHFTEAIELGIDLSTVTTVEFNEVNNTVYVEKLKVLLDINGVEEVAHIVGNHIGAERGENGPLFITFSDIFASASVYFNLYQGVGTTDDIDHLGNRRLRLIGELVKNHFRVGMGKLEKNIKDRMSTVDPNEAAPQNLINIKPLVSTLKEFYGSSQLSQFMDQTNPLAELTHKRRISALGSGGLSRDRAGVEVRDVHFSHYGRMCPIETPEGPNIGLITSLATYAQTDKHGFLKTPYFKVNSETGKILRDQVEYLTADEEFDVVVASAATAMNDETDIIEETRIVARYKGENGIFTVDEIDYIEISPQQIVSVASACIPFLEHDDANRALMGANMQRQAIPLLRPDSPIVGTGMEYQAARDSGSCCVSETNGIVEYVDAKKIVVKSENGEIATYNLHNFLRTNQDTCLLQRPIVTVGESVHVGDVLADGPSVDNGELALGQNVKVAFMTWNGYNYEDAIVMSERLVKDDVYTSIHIEEFQVEARTTKLGDEEITREIPNIGQDAIKHLDKYGVVIPGTEVKEGDILVGKVTPKGQTESTPEEKLLLAIFGEKSKEVSDTSLKVPHGGGGIVQSVQHFRKIGKNEILPEGIKELDDNPGVLEIIRIYVVKKRKISEGDKMAGRHGNKGVISRILPEEDMPFMEDGSPVDIMLNPLGVPSRMNIGQILELHLGMAAQKLGIKVATPVFDGCSQEDLERTMKEAGMDITGKVPLWDGRTGDKYDNDISVGIMYMIKLAHMVDDKLHARAVGPYTLVTQQPMGGKAQNGGQRFGEMEVWALEAYGAAYTLQEMLTVKSDDILGRNKVFKAIVDGNEIPEPSIPESFRVLTRELHALGIYVELINSETGENEVNKSIVESHENHADKFNITDENN